MICIELGQEKKGVKLDRIKWDEVKRELEGRDRRGEAKEREEEKQLNW